MTDGVNLAVIIRFAGHAVMNALLPRIIAKHLEVSWEEGFVIWKLLIILLKIVRLPVEFGKPRIMTDGNVIFRQNVRMKL